MKSQDEVKKELSYDQVQRIIDNQIARIEEEVSKNKEAEKGNSSEIGSEQNKGQCGLVRFFKRMFGRDKK